MDNYKIKRIFKNDISENKKIENLLLDENIIKDKNLDYTIGLYDSDENLIATGSSYKNTLRCFAVNKSYQGEGILNKIVTHLINYQYEIGNFHLFLYTKPQSAKFFENIGFFPIVNINNEIVFMENEKLGFENYLNDLKKESKNLESKNITAIVMNANPFTLGHLFLIETASKENDLVHLFILSEDSSLIPFSIRYKLILEGTKHLKNIIYHLSGDYIISNATFPSYFLKDENLVMENHAKIDIEIFKKIAAKLNIKKRYVGEEPFSKVTNIYNQVMEEEFSKTNIKFIQIPRKKIAGNIISASKVRELIHNNQLEKIKDFVPPSTYLFFNSKEAEKIINNIKNSNDYLH